MFSEPSTVPENQHGLGEEREFSHIVEHPEDVLAIIHVHVLLDHEPVEASFLNHRSLGYR